MHLFSCEYTSLELNFCYPSLNLGCGYFLGKAQHPRTPPHPVLEVSCILSKVLSFYLCCSPSWSVLLVRKPIRCSTSLIPKGVLHTFAPLPKPERPGFTPDRVTWGSLGGDQIPLLTPKGRTIIWIGVLTSLTHGALNWLPSLFRVPLCNQDLISSALGEVSPSVRSTGLLAPDGMLSQQAGNAKS
jgi:hypothetical protein